MLIYKGYIGQIDYNNTSGMLVGEVINSADVIEFCGKSAKEIKLNFQQSIDEYMTFQEEYAGEDPIPFVGHFNICLSTDKQSKVIDAAHHRGQSVSHWLSHQLDSYLEHYFKKIA